MNIITISRGSLRASELLAQKVSERLNSRIVTREDVIKAANKYGIRETGLGDLSFVEKSPSFWDKLGEKRKQYLVCFQTALLDFALEGSIVYHGRSCPIPSWKNSICTAYSFNFPNRIQNKDSDGRRK